MPLRPSVAVVRVLTCVCVVAVAVLFVLQARFALRWDKSMQFSLERGNLAYGYTLQCAGTSNATESITYGGHCYMLFKNTDKTWTNASAACVTYSGGYLPSISSAAEHNAIVSGLTGLSDVTWIGINDIASEGTFVWVNGESVSYTNWNAGQPDNSGGNQDCGTLHPPFGYKWDDNTCATSTDYICEFALCGNGHLNSGESCDDANTAAGDGCSASCLVESGWICSGRPSSCSAASCGDGIRAGAEACDDGNSSNTDACLNNCSAASCGDGFIRSGVEQCEPPGVGTCSASCMQQAGVSGTSNNTTGTTETITETFAQMEAAKRRAPPANCGNGFVEPAKGETCDNGRYNGLAPGCDLWCGMTFCGDGVVQPQTEECEPQQNKDGSFVIRSCGGGAVCTLPKCTPDGLCSGGCTWSFLPACQSLMTPNAAASSSAASAPAVSAPVSSTPVITIPAFNASSSVPLPPLVIIPSASSAPARSASSAESSSSSDVPFCGNGVVDSGEACDDGNHVLGDGCTPLCTLSFCGNGVLEHGEECDEGKNNNDDKPDSCSSRCILPRCGDDITDTAFGEQCDDGEFNSNVQRDSCRLDCRPARCGDGILDSGEQCDDGNRVENDGCTNVCMAVVCGNAMLDPGEQCDDGNFESNDGCSSVCGREKFSFFDWLLQLLRFR